MDRKAFAAAALEFDRTRQVLDQELAHATYGDGALVLDARNASSELVAPVRKMLVDELKSRIATEQAKFDAL